MSQNPIRINIALPSYGSVFAAECVTSLFSLAADRVNNIQYSVNSIDYADIMVSRNYLISDFYFNMPDQDYILFVDDDMGFHKNLIYKMLNSGFPICGTISPKRQLDLEKLWKSEKSTFEAAYAEACTFIGGKLTKVSDGLYSADRCGAGVLLISRKAIDTMVGKIPELIDDTNFKTISALTKFEKVITPFDKLKVEGRELSEDYSFCYRWKEICNGNIGVITDEMIGHVGKMTYKSKLDHHLMD